jgi:hypothetical protein
MVQKIFFHGTNRFVLDKILEKGLVSRYGRATLITNPKYAVGYSCISKTYLKNLIKNDRLDDVEKIKKRLIREKIITAKDSEDDKIWTKKADDYFKKEKFIIQDGIMLVFKDIENTIKVALESDIKVHPRKKVIDGQPNRFKTEQHGFFPKKKTKFVCMDKKYLVGIFAYNKIMLRTLDQIFYKIIEGKLKESNIQTYSRKLEKILNNKKIQISKPRISLKTLSEQMISGMIRNFVLREIRQTYLSIMKEQGWKIIPSGDHPVKVKDKEGIKKSFENMKKIIDKRFVPKDVKNEYYKLLSKVPLK